jgi:phosphohistidine phosphatase
MKLYLVRHAAAIDRSTAITEEHRFLTSEGRAFFRKTARTMVKRGIDPSLILTSPLLRAVQTAEILAEALEFLGPVLVTDELAPGFDAAALRKLLADYPSVDELVIVGHEPDLSTLAASLLASPAALGFKKGAAMKLKLAGPDFRGPAEFKWLAVGNKLVYSLEELYAGRS